MDPKLVEFGKYCRIYISVYFRNQKRLFWSICWSNFAEKNILGWSISLIIDIYSIHIPSGSIYKCIYFFFQFLISVLHIINCWFIIHFVSFSLNRRKSGRKLCCCWNIPDECSGCHTTVYNLQWCPYDIRTNAIIISHLHAFSQQ